MKRTLRGDEVKLWGLVTATVRPTPPKLPSEKLKAAKAARLAGEPEAPHDPNAPPAHVPISSLKPAKPPLPERAPEGIEPNRKRRIVRQPEAIGARIDLHGYDQDQARGALHAFIERAHADGARAVLIITGKGYLGGGVLKRRVPEWLAEPPSRPLVAGVSAADRRHGGEGALYVALKRRT
jgi:DNA-nicking Smr family endonuclease